MRNVEKDDVKDTIFLLIAVQTERDYPSEYYVDWRPLNSPKIKCLSTGEVTLSSTSHDIYNKAN